MHLHSFSLHWQLNKMYAKAFLFTSDGYQNHIPQISNLSQFNSPSGKYTTMRKISTSKGYRPNISGPTYSKVFTLNLFQKNGPF